MTPRSNLVEADLAKVWIAVQRDPAFDDLRALGSRFVPGEGRSVTPTLAFVGEAPGRNEDEQGRPFIGAAGQLLFRLVYDELGLGRDQVWTTNIVKYRPPGNRTPFWAELQAGAVHLSTELKLVQPKVVVTLGSSPLSMLKPIPISKAHGQPFARRGRTYLPLYHPAYLLRRQDLIPEFRADLRKLRRLTGDTEELVVDG